MHANRRPWTAVRASRAATLTCVFAALGCDLGGEAAGPPVEPVVLPPKLQRVLVEPPSLDRAVGHRVEVRDPEPVAAIQIDTFTQNPGVVDILWIVDNSGSMASERQRIGANFNRFVETLAASKTSFQIGVTSNNLGDPPAADPIKSGYQGTLRGATTKIITNATANAKDIFIANTTFPRSRSRWEQGLEAMRLALSEPLRSGANAGFLRPGAALAVIVATDEDDDSFGGTPYFARFLRGVKGQGNENLASFSTIGGDLPDGCVSPGEEGLYGSRADAAWRYVDVSRRTGGVVASICSASFEQTLVQIAEALNTLRRIFPLSIKPDAATISVRVNGVLIPQNAVVGWTFRPEIRSIVFSGNYVPPPGASIVIQYAIAP